MRINTNEWNRIRYGLYAPFYDIVAGRFARQRRRSVELLRPGVGTRLLIVGAGSGLDLEHLPPGLHVTATDITPRMVGLLEARARRLGLDVEARVMDGQALEFPDESFDAVLLHLIIAVIPDPLACMREVRRVLRPGGRAMVFDKFLARGRRPSLMRRVLNVASSALFSDINRSIEDMAEGAGLAIEHDEPAALGGMFRVLMLRKGGQVGDLGAFL